MRRRRSTRERSGRRGTAKGEVFTLFQAGAGRATLAGSFLSGFSRIERKTHETLRILQEAAVSRQQRQSREQQDQAAVESQPAGSARRDKRQRAANPGLHAMYPLRQGQEERVGSDKPTE